MGELTEQNRKQELAISDTGITALLHGSGSFDVQAAFSKGFLLLGDVIDRSEKDLLKLPYIGSEQIEEIRGILDKEHVSLAEEDYEADHVTMSFPDNLRGLEEHAYAVLLSGLTEGEREELETLTGDEKADRISELIDKKLELCRRRGEASIYSSFLFLGALLGYRGDFSEAGYAMLKGDEEEQPDKTNGYLILSLFYDAMKKGTMRPEARQSIHWLFFGSVSLYILLLIISSRLLHRQVTTELLLIILWTALEISSYQSAYCAEWIEAGMMWFLIILIGVCAVISLYFYLQFYRVNADRGYVYGMIPLILVEICMVIFLFSGILRRILFHG